jgi:hypothetical protein
LHAASSTTASRLAASTLSLPTFGSLLPSARLREPNS